MSPIDPNQLADAVSQLAQTTNVIGQSLLRVMHAISQEDSRFNHLVEIQRQLAETQKGILETQRLLIAAQERQERLLETLLTKQKQC
ncbi:MAG: hypothetical protein CV045_03305 [Cyanobacteria bacterium M5B4]|nr:hypothetical protein [Cyanobacteria bacterium KgW148]PLS69223.1 MAG: hypothetical protein CV045_03305 [Cyanobacteria bacterium M5B4]